MSVTPILIQFLGTGS